MGIKLIHKHNEAVRDPKAKGWKSSPNFRTPFTKCIQRADPQAKIAVALTATDIRSSASPQRT